MSLPRLPRPREAAWWAAAVVLAVLTAAVVGRAVNEAEAGRQRWGRFTPVVVTTAAVAAGQRITAADVRPVEMPAALVPGGTPASDPVGQVALVALLPGEVVLEERLAPAGLSPTAALVSPGRRAVAVPAGPGGHPPLVVGDAVDVLATVDAEPTVIVAVAATVLHVDTDTDLVTVAVTNDEARRLAWAVTHAAVTLVLTPER